MPDTSEKHKPEPLDKTVNARSTSVSAEQLRQIRRHLIGAVAAIDKALKGAEA